MWNLGFSVYLKSDPIYVKTEKDTKMSMTSKMPPPCIFIRSTLPHSCVFCSLPQAGFKAPTWGLAAAAVCQAALGDSASVQRAGGASSLEPTSQPVGGGPASQPHPEHQKPQAATVLPTR